MSEASDLFWGAHPRGLVMPGDRHAVELLTRAASLWRRSGRYLSAGLAMEHAHMAALGTEAVDSVRLAVLQDYEHCLASEAQCSLDALLAIHKLIQFRRFTSDGPSVNGLQEELGDRLLRCYGDSPNADSYLVKGFILHSNLDDPCHVCFPSDEVRGDGASWGNGLFNKDMPSAFRLLVSLADYVGALAIIRECPSSFTTPGLKGWRAAVLGFVDPEHAADRFAEAATAFSEDKEPSFEELQRRGGSWYGDNILLWAKYFRARAAVASLSSEPARVVDRLKEAATALVGTESGVVNGNVSRFRILVQTLTQLLGQQPGLTPDEARSQFLLQTRIFGPDAYDEVGLRFLNLVGQAFEGFRKDPAVEMVSGHLPAAMETLTRIPLIGANLGTIIAPALGRQALREAHGLDYSWMHRTLEAIRDESLLRKLILRLLQASPSPPAYGQIRHGPQEYGKDVAVLLEDGGRHILRMYQAKCGDLTIPGWREVRSQLEEIFLVGIPGLQLSCQVDETEGILICNGHAQPQVEPTMENWFEQELRDHRHTFRFMHLDDIVNWIHDQRLYNAFRNACAELGLSPEAKAGSSKRGGPSPKQKKAVPKHVGAPKKTAKKAVARTKKPKRSG